MLTSMVLSFAMSVAEPTKAPEDTAAKTPLHTQEIGKGKVRIGKGKVRIGKGKVRIGKGKVRIGKGKVRI